MTSTALTSTSSHSSDARNTLLGTNMFEMLLFRLRSAAGIEPELYGINVFKVREIAQMPTLTPIAGSIPTVLGVVNVRGQIIPVINLSRILGINREDGAQPKILLITEFGRTTQGFAVDEVEEIVRLDWSDVHSSEGTASSGAVNSFARLDGDQEGGRLAQVLDVEQILRDVNPGKNSVDEAKNLKASLELKPGARILAADDSAYARLLIEESLKAMGVPCTVVKSGQEAWLVLQAAKATAAQEGRDVQDDIGLVLTDLEMPEMDGFTLTRHIKDDSSLKGIPVVIHSSLSGSATEEQGRRAGADGFVAKFVAEELAQAMQVALAKKAPALAA